MNQGSITSRTNTRSEARKWVYGCVVISLMLLQLLAAGLGGGMIFLGLESLPWGHPLISALPGIVLLALAMTPVSETHTIWFLLYLFPRQLDRVLSLFLTHQGQYSPLHGEPAARKLAHHPKLDQAPRIWWWVWKNFLDNELLTLWPARTHESVLAGLLERGPAEKQLEGWELLQQQDEPYQAFKPERIFRKAVQEGMTWPRALDEKYLFEFLKASHRETREAALRVLSSLPTSGLEPYHGNASPTKGQGEWRR